MIKKFKDFIKEGFIPMVSKDITENEKHPIGKIIVFKYYDSSDGDDRPYKFRGKIIDNSKYNKLDVIITDRYYDKYSKETPCLKYEIGDIVEIHVGNLY